MKDSFLKYSINSLNKFAEFYKRYETPAGLDLLFPQFGKLKDHADFDNRLAFMQNLKWRTQN
jgi:hypothetical protein